MGNSIENKKSFDRCPKCFERIKGYYENIIIPNHIDNSDIYSIAIYFTNCDWCKTLILYKDDHHPYLIEYEGKSIVFGNYAGQIRGPVNLIFPEKTLERLSLDIPTDFASDYYEALKVLEISPKSSAALSRRCLQKLLEQKAHVRTGNLADQIQQVLDSKQLPSYLSESIDAIRIIGNFAAHPLKSTDSGLVVDVEPGEADWALEVLKDLLDFYIVQPARLQRMKDDLNNKLIEHGKPKMK